MKNSIRGFIDPYGLGLVVIIFGAFFFDIQNSFEPHGQDISSQQTTEKQQGMNHADTK